ncbi:transposase [Corallococcus sp. EGB]|uniref:transposase n=1 Tax=Corallococcus sp. EGB TaxID=1521117 RepID=UPI00351D11FA
MVEEKKPRRPRRSDTDEFKVGVVRLVVEERKPVSQVARDLDLTLSALRTRVDQAQAGGQGQAGGADECGAASAHEAAQAGA